VEEGSGTGVSLYRGPVGGAREGGPSTGNFERWMKGASLSEEAHCAVPRGMAPLLGTLGYGVME